MASKLLFLLTISFFFIVSLQHEILIPTKNYNSISHFALTKSIIGSQRGDTVKGINMLKKYLQRFGYLTVMSSSNQLIEDANNISHDNYFDDYFDKVTETAIKAYQLNRGFKPTGIVDNATLAAMSVPRCGVPDTTTNKMSSNNKTYCHGTTCIKFGSHYKFWTSKWPPGKFALTYAFKGFFTQLGKDIFAKAFAKWSSVSHFKFTETNGDADIVISLERLDHGDGHPFDGPGGIVAHAFPPVDGRIYLDRDDKWTDGKHEGTNDLNTVALHEIGHALGLAHSTVQEAVMWPEVPFGTARDLSQDDIDGIQALYK